MSNITQRCKHTLDAMLLTVQTHASYHVSGRCVEVYCAVVGDVMCLMYKTSGGCYTNPNRQGYVAMVCDPHVTNEWSDLLNLYMSPDKAAVFGIFHDQFGNRLFPKNKFNIKTPTGNVKFRLPSNRNTPKQQKKTNVFVNSDHLN